MGERTNRVVSDTAKSYQTGHPAIPEYEFPFEVLDKTPGGGNLGRIMWCVEIHPSPKRKGIKRLREVWIWARQTRDSRYTGRIFKLETSAEALTTSSTDSTAFTPWRIGFCPEHRGAVILEGYPENHHTKLLLAPSSSISCDVRFA